MEPLDFWIWFANYKEELEKFLLSDFSDYKPYHVLNEKIEEVSDLVVAELTISEKDDFVLILSCDGRVIGIPAVEKLFTAVPVIDKWLIKKYRQPSGFSNFPIDGISFEEKDLLIQYDYLPDAGKFDILYFVKGFKKNDGRYANAAFIYLDHCIGEYNSMTKISNVKFKKIGLFTSRKNLVTLSEFYKILQDH